MKKVLWTLNVDNYEPEITAITYPLLKNYANKIGADFKVISERKFPEFPCVYEKLQIHELGKEFDWNIYVDSDTLIHPDCYDFTEVLHKDTVFHHGRDVAGNRWTYDNYFRRDGRHIGSCNWFTIGSDWCLDLWKPLEDLTLDQAISNIHLTASEQQSGMKPEHLIDDYTVSRNIARFGLKFKTLPDIQQQLNDKGSYLYHVYTITNEEKIKNLDAIVKHWKL